VDTIVAGHAFDLKMTSPDAYAPESYLPSQWRRIRAAESERMDGIGYPAEQIRGRSLIKTTKKAVTPLRLGEQKRSRVCA
jgi:hypothetical protein